MRRSASGGLGRGTAGRGTGGRSPGRPPAAPSPADAERRGVWMQRQVEIQALQQQNRSMQRELQRAASAWASTGGGADALPVSDWESGEDAVPCELSWSGEDGGLAATPGWGGGGCPRNLRGDGGHGVLGPADSTRPTATAGPLPPRHSPAQVQGDLSSEAEPPPKPLRTLHASSSQPCGALARSAPAAARPKSRPQASARSELWEPEPYRPEPSTASGSRAPTPPRQQGLGQTRTASLTVAAEALQKRHTVEVEALQGELVEEEGRRRRERLDWWRRLHRLEAAHAGNEERVEWLAQQVTAGQQAFQRPEGRSQDLPAQSCANAEDAGRPRTDTPLQQNSNRNSGLEVRLDHLQEEVDLLRASEQWRLLEEGGRMKELRMSQEQAESKMRQEVGELRASVAQARTTKMPLDAQQRRLQDELAAMRTLEQRRLAQRGDELEAVRLSERRAQAASDRELAELHRELRHYEAMSRSHAAELSAARVSRDQHMADEGEMELLRGELTEETKVCQRRTAEALQHSEAANSESKGRRELEQRVCGLEAELARDKEQLNFELSSQKSRLELWALHWRSEAEQAHGTLEVAGAESKGRLELEKKVWGLEAEAVKIKERGSSELSSYRSRLELLVSHWQSQAEQAQERVEAMEASQGDALQTLELSAERSLASAAAKAAAWRRRAEAAEAQQDEAVKCETCLWAELDVLKQESKVLEGEVAQAAQSALSQETLEARRSLKDVRKRHAEELRELDRGVQTFRAERDAEASALALERENASAQLHALHMQSAAEAGELERQGRLQGVEAARLQGQLAEVRRHEEELVAAERLSAGRLEESLLQRLQHVEEVSQASSSEMRSHADGLVAQLQDALQLLDYIFRVWEAELGALPHELREQVLGSQMHPDDEQWELHLQSLGWSAAQRAGGPNLPLLRKGAWCAAAFGKVARCAAELFHRNGELQLAMDAAPMEGHPTRRDQPASELRRHREQRSRSREQDHTRELANAQLEEKINHLQASLRATGAGSPHEPRSRSSSSGQGSEEVRVLPAGEQPQRAEEAVALQSISQLLPPPMASDHRLHVAAHRLTNLAAQGLGFPSENTRSWNGTSMTRAATLLGDLPVLAERCEEQQKELRSELRSELATYQIREAVAEEQRRELRDELRVYNGERREAASKEARLEAMLEHAEARLSSTPAESGWRGASSAAPPLPPPPPAAPTAPPPPSAPTAWPTRDMPAPPPPPPSTLPATAQPPPVPLGPLPPGPGPPETDPKHQELELLLAQLQSHQHKTEPPVSTRGLCSGTSEPSAPASPPARSPEPSSRWNWQDCQAPDTSAREATAYPPSPPLERCIVAQAERLGEDESAAGVFERAEALCEAQHFGEAVVLFRRVLHALQSNPDPGLRLAEAEVWAHMGVAMQFLDDIRAAIDSYRNAVRLDPSLHVCFANLATLQAHLQDFNSARASITRALELEPVNEAYLNIQRSLHPSRGRG